MKDLKVCSADEAAKVLKEIQGYISIPGIPHYLETEMKQFGETWARLACCAPEEVRAVIEILKTKPRAVFPAKVLLEGIGAKLGIDRWEQIFPPLK